MLLRRLAPLALGLCASCQVIRQSGVTLASEPPGARIFVDDQDSGFVTPCNLGLSRDEQTLELRLEGYRSVARHISPDTRTWGILWNECFLSFQTWRFPLWLSWVDGLMPFKIERAYSPGRIFVRLRRAEEE